MGKPVLQEKNSVNHTMQKEIAGAFPVSIDASYEGERPQQPFTPDRIVLPSFDLEGRSASFSFDRFRLSSSGFTLLELVLATLISSLVIGILSVCLGFSLRIWERQQNQKRIDTPAVLELLKWQLAEFNPTPVTFLSQSAPLLTGDKNSITFTTDHSVKSISKGVPVVARYIYLAKEKKLHYAEIPFDPYHPEPIQEFMKAKVAKDKSQPQFFPIEMEEFSLAYAGEEKEAYVDSWEADGPIPRAVMIKWKIKDDPALFSYAVYPNFFFAKKQQETTQSGGALQITPRQKSQRRGR